MRVVSGVVFFTVMFMLRLSMSGLRFIVAHAGGGCQHGSPAADRERSRLAVSSAGDRTARLETR
jgi:hypothetical protein